MTVDPRKPLTPGKGEYAILPQPLFGQPRPEPGRPAGLRPRTSPWHPILDKVRQRPFEEAIVAIFDKGSPARTRRDQQNAYTSIHRLVAERYPLERWVVMVRTDPSKWNSRQLRVTFMGTYTAEEQEQWRARRRQSTDAARAARRAKRERAEIKAREQAMQASRRPPR